MIRRLTASDGYKTGGIAFFFILRGLIIFLTHGLLWKIIRERSNAYRTVLLTLFAGAAPFNNWAVRVQWFASPLFVLSLYVLLEWQQGRFSKIYFLPGSVLLWANHHGSVVLPFLLMEAATRMPRLGTKNMNVHPVHV